MSEIFLTRPTPCGGIYKVDLDLLQTFILCLSWMIINNHDYGKLRVTPVIVHSFVHEMG